MKQRFDSAKRWIIEHKKLLLKAGGGLTALLVLIQILYPGDTLLPFSSIDGLSVGGVSKTAAVKLLDAKAAERRLTIALGKIDERFDEPRPGDVGLKISHRSSVEKSGYPWYLRVVPSSLFWFGIVQSEEKPAYAFDQAKAEEYLTKKFGADCVITAKDASLKLENDALKLVPSEAGANCDRGAAIKAIKATEPHAGTSEAIEIPATAIAPAVGDDDAEKLAERLIKTSRDGVELKVADKVQAIPQKEILTWLTFKPGGDGLTFEINAEKANAYLSKTATPVITKPAGITKVTTSDFTETSRQDGATGQTLALQATLSDIASVLNDEKTRAQAQVTSLPPKVDYTRTYSKTSTGIAAQLKFYDDDNAGVFGVAFSELGGQGLSAQHNGDRQFVTASTYKLFVAFSTIKRVEAGQMKWEDTDIAGGRDLNKCFDDMIVKSDNACAEALIKKIGAKDLNADIKSLGLTNSAFKAGDNVTTANDLSKYLTQLDKGTMPIKPENRERLLGVMKRNVYRQGVPAGASGQVADKVGFLAGLLHDATIVYSPKGTYVLVVLTDGSSWANIADLTRRIEALR